MDLNIIVYLSLLVLGFILFSREIFPFEISALLILVILVLTGIVDHKTAFANFGNDSIILIGSLFVMIAGLRRTGLIRKVEDFLLYIGGSNKYITLLLMMSLVAFVSAFVSNTATLAVIIPIAVSMARSFGEAPRTWLLPLAYISVLGGMNTLIGTSTNIIISGMLPELGLPEFKLFTTTVVGLPLLFAGGIYILTTRNFFLNRGGKTDSERIDVKYNLRNYTSEVRVLDRSPLCGKSLENAAFFKESDSTVLGVVRKDEPVIYPRAGFVIQADDKLIVEGNITKLTELVDRFGLEFSEQEKTQPDKPIDPEVDKEKKQAAYTVELHEVLITASSMINNRTAAEVFLRNRYRISLIAVNRQGVTIHEKLSKVRLIAGDILVVQFLGYIDNTTLDFLGLIPLQKLSAERYQFHNAPLAAGIYAASLIIGSTTSIPLAICFLTGAILLVMTGILRIDEVYDAIEWKVLIFIAAILSLGKGMVSSGTAAYLGDSLSIFFTGMPPFYSLLFFLVLTAILTSLLSNQATAVVMIPLAITTSHALGLDPMPFVIAVTIGASCCFMTPFEPVFMMVYGPGGYRFSDFVKTGFLLNVICIILGIILIPIFWPL